MKTTGDADLFFYFCTNANMYIGKLHCKYQTHCGNPHDLRFCLENIYKII